jgi:hypothetical protein
MNSSSNHKNLNFKIELMIEIQNMDNFCLPWNSVFEFIFGGFIKMYFINKLAQALVLFVSTKFVLCNAANG